MTNDKKNDEIWYKIHSIIVNLITRLSAKTLSQCCFNYFTSLPSITLFSDTFRSPFTRSMTQKGMRFNLKQRSPILQRTSRFWGRSSRTASKDCEDYLISFIYIILVLVLQPFAQNDASQRSKSPIMRRQFSTACPPHGNKHGQPCSPPHMPQNFRGHCLIDLLIG